MRRYNTDSLLRNTAQIRYGEKSCKTGFIIIAIILDRDNLIHTLTS